jgi:hypothetical protein
MISNPVLDEDAVCGSCGERYKPVYRISAGSTVIKICSVCSPLLKASLDQIPSGPSGNMDVFDAKSKPVSLISKELLLQYVKESEATEYEELATYIHQKLTNDFIFRYHGTPIKMFKSSYAEMKRIHASLRQLKGRLGYWYDESKGTSVEIAEDLIRTSSDEALCKRLTMEQLVFLHKSLVRFGPSETRPSYMVSDLRLILGEK